MHSNKVAGNKADNSWGMNRQARAEDAYHQAAKTVNRSRGIPLRGGGGGGVVRISFSDLLLNIYFNAREFCV